MLLEYQKAINETPARSTDGNNDEKGEESKLIDYGKGTGYQRGIKSHRR
jgi:hypothetical protein